MSVQPVGLLQTAFTITVCRLLGMSLLPEILSCIFVSGGIAGDPTSEQVFLRVGEAFLAAMVAINIIARLFNINL